MFEELKAFAASARANDGEQRSAVLSFFDAFARVISDGAIKAHPDGATLRRVCPVRICGPGPITVRGKVELGVYKSPLLLQGIYLEARTRTSSIFIDDMTYMNNGSTIISNGASIQIGKRCLIGSSFFCADTNFHGLGVHQRFQEDPDPRPVVIEDDVFIGEGVKILKGVHVARGSIIAAGAVLFPGFTCPPNATIRGNPAVAVRADEETLDPGGALGAGARAGSGPTRPIRRPPSSGAAAKAAADPELP